MVGILVGWLTDDITCLVNCLDHLLTINSQTVNRKRVGVGRSLEVATTAVVVGRQISRLVKLGVILLEALVFQYTLQEITTDGKCGAVALT